jgi:neutral ceramidase
LQAIAARKPSRLSCAEWSVGFAMNRRAIKDGRYVGFAANAAGPVDHSLPLLRVSDIDGKLVAVLCNYACHCTSNPFNQIHGDWAGVAQAAIEHDHPGVQAMVSIGCGADVNPQPRGTMEFVEQHGREVSRKVERLLLGSFKPIAPRLATRQKRIQLPYDKLPTRQELQARLTRGSAPRASTLERHSAAHAAALLSQMERGKSLPGALDYLITTWAFGDDLMMVFLPGEVVVDYALRLKRELDHCRLWVTAYANDVPCYIPSRRILDEGGYEADRSMLYCVRPNRFSPAIENLIITTVESFSPPQK